MPTKTEKDSEGRSVRVYKDGSERLQVTAWILRKKYEKLEKQLGKVKDRRGLPCVKMATLAEVILERAAK